MNDQLIVTKLRPMSEVPTGEWILVYDGEKFFQTRIRPSTIILNKFNKSFEGWIPMPTYKPE